MSVPPAAASLGPVLRAVLYGGGLLALGHVLLYAHAETDPLAVFGEYGRLEDAQVALLLASTVLWGAAALARPASRPLSVVFAGLLVALAVREHNNFFKDHVADGAWQAVCAVVVAGTLAAAWPWRRRALPAFAFLARRQAFAWMAAAVMLALFGQLLDEQRLWDLVLGRDPPYAARRLLEESFELAALYLFLAGTVEYHLALRGEGDQGASSA